ncbi:hypothetical protein F4808DRAFT_476527, partial [Astrocystis sublimbata]
RQLSPRIVHYTAFQVLWECKETYKVSEINPIGDEIPSLHRDEYLDHPPRVPHNLLYSIWNGAVLYEEYPPPTNIDFLRPKYIYFALPELKAPRCHDLFKGLYLAREPKEDTIGDWYGQYQKEVNVVGTLRARMIDDYCSWYRLVEEVSQKQFTHSTDHTPEDTACLHRRRDARDTQCRSNPVVSMESDGRGADFKEELGDESFVCFDMNDDSNFDGIIYCLCLSIAARKPMQGNESPSRHVYGLALVPTREGEQEYKRIGWIWTSLQFWQPTLTKSHLTIV